MISSSLFRTVLVLVVALGLALSCSRSRDELSPLTQRPSGSREAGIQAVPTLTLASCFAPIINGSYASVGLVNGRNEFRGGRVNSQEYVKDQIVRWNGTLNRWELIVVYLLFNQNVERKLAFIAQSTAPNPPCTGWTIITQPEGDGGSVCGANATLTLSGDCGTPPPVLLPLTSTPTVTLSPVCAGAAFRLSVTGSVPASATARLSNAAGSFAAPVALGAVRAGINSLTVPFGVAPGSGYRMRVFDEPGNAASNPSAAFTVNGPAFTSTPTLIGSSRCPGETVRIAFTVGGCSFGPTNGFRAVLSDANGIFGSGERELGPVSPGITTLTVPNGTPAGSGYRIRVVSSSPVLTSATTGVLQVKECR